MTKRDLTEASKDEPMLGDQMKKIAEALDKQKAQQLLDPQPTQNRATGSRAPRSSREMETREAEAAPLSWKPADVLPDPPQRPGFVHRWVRGSSRGEIDSVNMAKAMREGWRPCAANEYPEIALQMYNRGESINTIEFGGLILCRLPTEEAKAREKYYTDLSLRQIQTVNARIHEEEASEDRVRYENQSRSRVNDRAPWS